MKKGVGFLLISIASILIFGWFFAKLSAFLKIPDVVAMIFAGIFINYFNLYDKSIFQISDTLRQIALVVIILRAGFSLDLNKLKAVGKSAFLLSFVPAICEILAICFVSSFIFDMPIVYGLILGCTVTAVSPAIIIPRMIFLQKNGYGTDKNIPELIMSSASVDDIIVIVLFYCFINNFALNSLNFTYISALISIPILLVLSFTFAYILSFISSLLIKKFNSFSFSVVLISFYFVLLKFETYINFSALLCILIVAVITKSKNQVYCEKISFHLSKFWSIMSIILFVLVGMSLDLTIAKTHILSGLLVLVAGVTIRNIAVLLCLRKSVLDLKERLFCVFASIPKATVQASLGYIPLSLGLLHGELISSISTLSIIVFASLGSLLIDNSYKILLKRSNYERY